MRFKRHKPKERGDLDRWALPKRVKTALIPVPEVSTGVNRRSKRLCRKTKKLHRFEVVESVLTLYRFSEVSRYANYYQQRVACLDRGRKKLKGLFKIPTSDPNYQWF